MRLDPQSIPKFHGPARSYPAFKVFWNQDMEKDHSPESRWRAEREVGRGELQVNFKTHLSLARVEGWASKIGPDIRKNPTSGLSGRDASLRTVQPRRTCEVDPTTGGGKGSEGQEGSGATRGQSGTGGKGRRSAGVNTRGSVNPTIAGGRPKDSEKAANSKDDYVAEVNGTQSSECSLPRH